MNDLSLKDQITEMQRKIHILEEHGTAYRERTQSAIKKNRELILQLRQENMTLYRKLPDARTYQWDEHLMKEMDNYRNMTVKEVETLLEHKVLTTRKRLNAQTHHVQTCQKRLEEMQLQLQRQKQGGSTKPTFANSRALEPNAKKLWVLENNLEKTQLKCQEAENITRCYLELKNQLQEESLTFQGQLDGLAADILQHREELHKLTAMRNTSQLWKDAAKAELQQLEEWLYKEHKKRDHKLAKLRKEDAEGKAELKKLERLPQRAPVQPDDLSEAQQDNIVVSEEEGCISTYENIFQQITEVTGVNNTQEIVEWYLSQKETCKRLQEAKNEGILLQLKKDKEQLQQQFQDMKYPGSAKLSSCEQLIQQEREKLEAAQQRCNAARKHLDCLVKTLNSVRFGVENLAYKLEQITLDEGVVTELSPDSEGFVVHLLGQCELKLRKLRKEFCGMDTAAVMETMDKEEFSDLIEEKMPSYNNRIKLPDTENLDPFNDDEESEADEEGVLTREALKRQSQLFVEGHTKRKYATKKR